jgi:hypothetical protein
LNHATNLEDLALKLRGVDRGVWNGKGGQQQGHGELKAPTKQQDDRKGPNGPIIIDLPK